LWIRLKVKADKKYERDALDKNSVQNNMKEDSFGFHKALKI